MRKTNLLFILILIVSMIIIPFTKVNAHTVELDPDKLISFPWMITNGTGKVTIDDEITGHSIYYQAVEISNTTYTQIEEIEKNGDTELDKLNEEVKTLKTEYQDLRTLYNEAYDTYSTIKSNETATEEEIANAKATYEEAYNNYQNKVSEYNNKVNEYNAKATEINNNVKALVPTYVESNWTKTEDGSFSVDLSQFSGDRAFAIWVKLVASDGTIVYDEGTYTMSGTKPKEIAVESITLDKSELTIEKGSNYTLTPTITPDDATNKLVIWTTNDENVATVEDGKITAVAEGTTTITATTKDGEYTAICKVTVTKKDTTSTTENKETDNTLAEGELPKAGSLTYIIVIAILVLGMIGIVMYRKVKYLNFK